MVKFILSGWQDSNLRPPGPKPGAMTGLRYTPKRIWRRVRDSNPWYSFPYACLANMSFRPLRQLSMLKELAILSGCKCNFLLYILQVILKFFKCFFTFGTKAVTNQSFNPISFPKGISPKNCSKHVDVELE